MSRRTDSHRGAVMAAQVAEAALTPTPLFPSLSLSPELAAEWRGILAAARAQQQELEQAMAALRRG